jgi:signal transduction histidine kinase
MRAIFSKISLKSVLYIFTGSTICLLFIVIFLASKQYFLYRHCEQIVNSSQNLLFQFTGMKEHINDTLLSQKPLNSSILIKEINNLDKELTRVLDDILIPEEFKLAFITQVDLVNITVGLRNLQNTPEAPTIIQLAALSTQLRSISTKLTGFHQLITRYTQTQLMGLHRALVGMLALVVATVSIMLLVLTRYITTPIIHYCRSLFPTKSSGEISLFTLNAAIESLASQQSEKNDQIATVTDEQWPVKELARLYRYSSIGHLLAGLSHELTNLSNGVINYTQALIDLISELQLDSDSKNVLEKLFSEEKKMSQILTEMILFTSGSENGEMQTLTLEEIFTHIKTLTRGTLKTDNIELAITLTDNKVSLNYHVSDLQLVILSAIQSSRTALNERLQNSAPDKKRIEIAINDDSITESHIIISIYDNGAPWKLEKSLHGNSPNNPWHNMNFCKQFLQTFDGNLDVIREEDQLNLCTISIPRHGKTTD